MIIGDRVEAAHLLFAAGFTSWQIVVMGAIGMAESGLNEHEHHLNDHDPASRWYLSLDLGAWQINDAANQQLLTLRGLLRPDRAVSQQLLDAPTNAKAARIVFESRNGSRDPVGGYGAWTTFRTGAYLPHRPAAITAAIAAGVIPS